jgi:hypothetical protein
MTCPFPSILKSWQPSREYLNFLKTPFNWLIQRCCLQMKETFMAGLSKIEEKLGGITREEKKASAQASAPVHVTDEFIFKNEIIPQIVRKVAEIERREFKGEVLSVNVDFDIHTNFNTMNCEELLKEHQKLIVLEETLADMTLIVKYHRGMLYLCLQKAVQDQGHNFKDYLEKEKLCHKTVLRYMLVAGTISKFPRLLLCGLSFTQLLKYKKKMSDFFGDEGKALTDRLSASINMKVQNQEVDVQYTDVCIPKASFAAGVDWEHQDKYDPKDPRKEQQIEEWAAATEQQLRNCPDEVKQIDEILQTLSTSTKKNN